ncbi:hypothetical protein JXB11_04815 [Candidatus Woesearchaeota archaeon]|nr:hypothetical protein [Candidatus Woesearchaeota archaeon]
MEIVVLIVVLFRLIIPFSIFRWPFWGILASLIADALDYSVFDLTTGSLAYYQQLDKLLDLYYLSIAFFVSLRWKGTERITSIALFCYRCIGLLLFTITKTHLFLFIFPNLFEYFFIFWACRNKFFSGFKLTPKKLAAVLLIILCLKLPGEYLLHVMGADPWAWMKSILGL